MHPYHLALSYRLGCVARTSRKKRNILFIGKSDKKYLGIYNFVRSPFKIEQTANEKKKKMEVNYLIKKKMPMSFRTPLFHMIVWLSQFMLSSFPHFIAFCFQKSHMQELQFGYAEEKLVFKSDWIEREFIFQKVHAHRLFVGVEYR